jgi:PDZ domain-containing secreted protein
MPQSEFDTQPGRRFIMRRMKGIALASALFIGLAFDIGVSGELGNSKLAGFISVNATASKNDGNYQAITVGIRAPL